MIVQVLDPYTKSRAIWVCPSGQKTVYTGTNNDQIAMNLGYSEYFYNTANSVVPYRNWTSLAALTGSTAGVAKIALVADSRASGASAVAGIFNDWGDRDGFCFPNEGKDFGLGRLKYANDWTGTCPATPSGERHPGYGANVVFADGHAQFINGGAMRGHGTIGNDGSIGGITEWPVVNPLNLPPT
jgi:prepilin-type processing-associated H-X9-DG protein